MANRTLHSIRDLAIGHGDRTLCSGISFDICEGDCIMLCGANGSGKTTLMKALTGLSEEVMMIPARIPKVAGFTLREFARIGCFSQSDMAGKLSDQQEESLDAAIGTLGLTHLADRDISTLSDGEFQKAGLVSDLVRNASVILLDEPTAFLDAENRISVLATLREICDRKGIAVIFSTHDLHDGLKVCTKVLAFGADGRFRCSGNTSESMSETVSTIFSRSRETIL
ncbi:MAG: ABC transporter ATP-binding protein [Bacteroidales bacterium]|nr:ABC transporter ATP-binding protein [Bacteroidales bacterium]